MVREYCKDQGWPYAKRLSLSGANDVGDIDLHPRIAIEVKATQGRMLIGPWMNEVDLEKVNADADYGILVIKYKGVGARNVGKFLTCMRWGRAEHLTSKSGLPNERMWEVRYGVTQHPIELLKDMDVLGREVGQMSMVVHRQRSTPLLPGYDYHFMWLEDRLTLLQMAGYGEVRHLEKERDE
jgi:hypothetical protein